MRASNGWCAASVLLTIVIAASARAQPEPLVVLVDPDPALEHAIALALEPWGASVRATRDASPGATMPGSAERGRAVARAHEALAVVWVSQAEDGYALWVYDRREDRVLARALPIGPPFDEPTAAEVALIVKTLLRHSPVAPAAPAVASAVSTEITPPPPRAEPAPVVWLRVWGGARFLSTSPSAVEARMGLALAFWPAELDEHLGLGVRAASGPGVGVDTPGWNLRWTDTELSVWIAGRFVVAGPLELGVHAAVGAHVTTLDGRLADGRAVSEVRVDPIAGADLEVALRIDRRLRLSLVGGTMIPLQNQVFMVGTQRALAVERLNAGVALHLAVGLP